MITMITIYSLFVVPFILVFNEVYEWCPEIDVEKGTDANGNKICKVPMVK